MSLLFPPPLAQRSWWGCFGLPAALASGATSLGNEMRQLSWRQNKDPTLFQGDRLYHYLQSLDRRTGSAAKSPKPGQAAHRRQATSLLSHAPPPHRVLGQMATWPPAGDTAPCTGGFPITTPISPCPTGPSQHQRRVPALGATLLGPAGE